MRDFSDADRNKKRGRIQLPENPGNLSQDALSRLEVAVRAAVKDGYVACPTAWRVAKDESVSRLDVGTMIDRLGIRVTDCQLGAFKVGKTAHAGAPTAPFTDETAARVDALAQKGQLTCAAIFALARELGVQPRSVSEAANVRGHKFRHCQLGCF